MARHQTHRTDLNQPGIVAALRMAGIEVHVIDRPVDLLCGFRKCWVLLEVKGKDGRYTQDQQDFFDAIPKGPVFTVQTPEEAIQAVYQCAKGR